MSVILEIKNKYDAMFYCRGIFYKENIDNQEQDFRLYLDIKENNENASPSEKVDFPQLMVIMMNPGSSTPIQKTYGVEVDTNPDDVQYKIMEVMDKCDIKFARVLNLSDCINANSKSFINDQIDILPKEEDFSHSIFDRPDDFKTYFQTGVPVLIAWGVDPKLKDLKANALKKIKEANNNDDSLIFGRRQFSDEQYYYPKPIGHAELEQAWMEEIPPKLQEILLATQQA